MKGLVYIIEVQSPDNVWLWDEVRHAHEGEEAFSLAHEVARERDIELSKVRVRKMRAGRTTNVYRADKYIAIANTIQVR